MPTRRFWRDKPPARPMIPPVQGPMLYDLALRPAGLLTGGLLIAGHAYALLLAGDARRQLAAFPRSRPAGTVLIALAALWCLWVVNTMDLGEFARFKPLLLAGIPVSAWLLWRYVEEFLSVRALGMLLLLAAEPLLEAAFHRPETSRLFLVSLVYVWIIAGMFLVGMPYLFRDAVAWLSGGDRRWKIASVAGLAYGVLLCVLAFGW